VVNLDFWICIGKSLCLEMCKKKGVEGGGGFHCFLGSASEGIQRSSSRGGLESPWMQAGTQECQCVTGDFLY